MLDSIISSTDCSVTTANCLSCGGDTLLCTLCEPGYYLTSSPFAGTTCTARASTLALDFYILAHDPQTGEEAQTLMDSMST